MPTAAEPLPEIRHGRLFEVTIPGLTLKVGYFTQVTGFSAQLDVLEYAEGGINDYVHRLPTRIKQGNITLKRGVTGESELLEWFTETVVKANPQDLSIAMYDSLGNIQKPTWSFRNAYPVKWSSSDLNAGGTEFLTESLEIAHFGMELK
ncbi:MAG TPA: phage tail protein [Solirubrobacter sp.]|jgi:phage tail-like protein|nr:phage tail protein [Solirubrobacter sp.]